MLTNDMQMHKLAHMFGFLLTWRGAIRSLYRDGPLPELFLPNEIFRLIKETCDAIRADVGESRSDSDVSPGSNISGS